MAIPKKDYENERVGGALIMALAELERVRELRATNVAPAEIEHALATAEFTIATGRQAVLREDVSDERKAQVLGWLDDYAAELALLGPAPSTQ